MSAISSPISQSCLNLLLSPRHLCCAFTVGHCHYLSKPCFVCSQIKTLGTLSPAHPTVPPCVPSLLTPESAHSTAFKLHLDIYSHNRLSLQDFSYYSRSFLSADNQNEKNYLQNNCMDHCDHSDTWHMIRNSVPYRIY